MLRPKKKDVMFSVPFSLTDQTPVAMIPWLYVKNDTDVDSHNSCCWEVGRTAFAQGNVDQYTTKSAKFAEAFFGVNFGFLRLNKWKNKCFGQNLVMVSLTTDHDT